MYMKNFYYFLTLGYLIFTFSGCNTEPPEPERTPLLLISIDGLKPGDVAATETPTLDLLASQGAMAESMIPVFPTSTFPNHYSLVTGLYTNSTGVISNTMYDPEMERWFRLSDRSAVSDGRWYGGEPIWVTAEKNDIRTATMFWPGSEAEIMGIRPTRWYQYDGDLPYEARVDSVLSWMSLKDETRPEFMTLYFSKVDSYGHRYGAGSDSVLSAIRYVDGILGYMVDELKRSEFWPEIDIIITSDHGMMDLSENRLIFFDDLIDQDLVNVINWSPVVMIQPVEGKKEEVYEALKSQEENYTVYYKEDVPERLHFGKHRRVPDLVMIADLGWTVTNRSFYERRGIIAGTHGFDNEHPEMHAFFMASGPSFKNETIIEPFQSIHIYELMAHLLRVEPAPNDGNIEVLRKILND